MYPPQRGTDWINLDWEFALINFECGNEKPNQFAVLLFKK